MIKEAVNQLKFFTMDEVQRELYESQRMAVMDEISMLDERYRKGEAKGEAIGEAIGIQKGEAIGIQKGEAIGIRKTVVNALQAGLDVETIHKITGMSKEEICKLQKQSQDR